MLKLLVPKNVLLPASVGAALNLSDTELENGTKLEVNTNAVKFNPSNSSALLAYEALVALSALAALIAREEDIIPDIKAPDPENEAAFT